MNNLDDYARKLYEKHKAEQAMRRYKEEQHARRVETAALVITSLMMVALAAGVVWLLQVVW